MIISIGTAQLGSSYGISNRSKKIRIKDFKKILDLAYEKGINNIDTAFRYGDAHKKLSQIDISNFKITTKVFFENSDIDLQLVNIKKKIIDFLRKNKLKYIDTILIHNPKSLNSTQLKKINYYFRSIKNEYFHNFGVSIYSPEEFINLSTILEIDEIQVPFNLFDRRFAKKELIDLYHKKRCKVSIRSIFLQGLLLMDKKKQTKLFPKYKKLFIKFNEYLKAKKIDPYSACIDLALRQSWAYKAILGFDNFDQFKSFTRYEFKQNYRFPISISSNDDKLINPSTWALK